MQFGKNQVSDRDLLKTVNQRLSRTGTASQSKVNVSVQQGNVTLTGTLQHAIQRIPILKAITRVPGVRRVIDQMQHIVKKAPRPEANRYVRIPDSPSDPQSSEVSVAEDISLEEQPRSE